MKTLKLIIVCLALFAGKNLLAQNLIVNNNSPLDNGFATFGFIPGSSCDYTQQFSASTTGYSASYSCPPGWLDHVHIVFDDLTCPTNPQPAVMVTPTSPTATHTDCGSTPITYIITLTLSGSDWIVDIQ